jgi:hypothetical protein
LDIEGLNLSFYIPSFHINAHRADCFFSLHPDFSPDVGYVDGEDVERLWSQLGNLSSIVRQSSKASRFEQLEDSLAHFWESKYFALPQLLQKRRKKGEMDVARLTETVQANDGVLVGVPALFCADFNQADVIHAYIARQTLALRSLKRGSGQHYASQIKKGINKARNKLLALADEGIEANNVSFVEGNNYQEEGLLYSKAKREVVLSTKELQRLKTHMERIFTKAQNVFNEQKNYITRNLLNRLSDSLSTLSLLESVDSDSETSSSISN